ncbi:MAG: two-component system, sensor histidine kinase and response regulator [Bacteroidota bacterium]|nr:two-component system, sensor histidine kinase and response regulator [Bacteroidota bacterium]
MELKDIDNQMLKALLNASRDAIFAIDMDYHIIFVSEASEKIYGFSEKDSNGCDFFDLLIPKQYINELRQQIDNSVKLLKQPISSFVHEIYLKNYSGSLIPSEVHFTRFEFNNQIYHCCFARDIRDKIILEEETTKLIEEIQISKEVIEQNANELVSITHKLAESEEQLTELNASKDKFFSIIAHDLKGPFQGFLGYSDILNKDVDNLSKDEIKEFAKNLNESAKHLFKLLENLLHWSRIQRGMIEITPMNFNMSQLTDMVLDVVTMNAVQKKIKLVKSVNPETEVLADVNMINTVLRNLVSNAIKFTKEDGVIEIGSYRNDDGLVAVYVKDDGVGMNEEAMKKVFRIDQHHTTLGTNREVGTGLGLILCKDLVEKNGGKIFVESSLGIGSIFTFTLPPAS